MKASWIFLAATPLLGLCIGCGASAPVATQGDQGTANNSSIADRSQAGFSPTVSAEQGSAPQQSVAIFLDCLRRGDELTANSMLTTKAREELQKTAYAVQPLGTPEGRFEIGRLGFPYPEKNVALVECQWREPATATEPELIMDIVCEVYQESEGWRIAGMAVTVQGEDEALVIDFEDGARLQEMLDIANGQPPAGQAGQGAQPVQQSVQLNPADLPALPQFAPSDNSQIALPPNSGAFLR